MDKKELKSGPYQGILLEGFLECEEQRIAFERWPLGDGWPLLVKVKA
jgi:hypothetical protein